jgi:hypothetical protein
MEKESLFILQAPTKVISRISLRKVLENKLFLMVMYLVVTTKMENLMGRVNMNGRMERIIKVILSKV